jgi:hypothetical protein
MLQEFLPLKLNALDLSALYLHPMQLKNPLCNICRISSDWTHPIS